MSDEQKKYIKELMLAAHQSKDSEYSDLIKDVIRRIDALQIHAEQVINEVESLKGAVESLQDFNQTEVLPNVRSWNKTTETVESTVGKLAWILLSLVVGGSLAYLGLQ